MRVLSSGNSARLALLHLVFLGQQACLTFDAIFRSLIRSFITGERLLEWETAAQAESRSAGRAGIDRYLFITPFLSVGIAIAHILLRQLINMQFLRSADTCVMGHR